MKPRNKLEIPESKLTPQIIAAFMQIKEGEPFSRKVRLAVKAGKITHGDSAELCREWLFERGYDLNSEVGGFVHLAHYTRGF